MTDRIQVGDVCLDLAQGRPVHVVEALDTDAAAWSEANNYELTENYGNSRLGASDDDAVYEVVYCSSAKSKPSKTYAMPESRLLRVETEAADDGRPVAERITVTVLEELFDAAYRSATDSFVPDLEALAEDAVGEELTNEARELASVEHTISDGDADE